jgi:hypothetical protein
MKRKTTLLKISFVIMLLIAALHTFFVIIGGPPLPTTHDFLKMQELMRSIQVDSGGGIMRTTQNFMDGFNIIVSIFLISLPLLGWTMLKEIKDNEKAVRKLTVVTLLSELAFFLTSLTLLAIGGTVLSGITCVLLLISLLIKK